MAATERDFRALFDAINRMVTADPTDTAQILALILAGGPFRPFLERPELLNKVVLMAKNFAAEAQKEQKLAKQEPIKSMSNQRAQAAVPAHHRKA